MYVAKCNDTINASFCPIFMTFYTGSLLWSLWQLLKPVTWSSTKWIANSGHTCVENDKLCWCRYEVVAFVEPEELDENVVICFTPTPTARWITRSWKKRAKYFRLNFCVAASAELKFLPLMIRNYCSVLSNWERFIKMRAAFHTLSFLPNSGEDGGKKGSSHFDENLSLW